MVLRLEADPRGCGKVNPCPKIWGTDDHTEVLIQGKRPTAAHRAEIDLPDDEELVTFPRQALLEWAARQFAERPL